MTPRVTRNGSTPTTTQPTERRDTQPAPPKAKAQRPGNAGWAPKPAKAHKSNDDILMVAMNKDGKTEAGWHQARGVKVTLVENAARPDTIVTKDKSGAPTTHDLATSEGARSFAKTLGLPPAQTEKIADAIHGSFENSRDELAQLAQVFAKGERGEGMPSRLVLSGHSGGSTIFGDGNGSLSLESLGKLTAAMPEASKQIEDLHLSACNAGFERHVDQYRAMFPAVKTIWGYTGSAPGTHSGAQAHQGRWEKATRGGTEELRRAIADGTRKGENVAAWSKATGYVDGKPPKPLETVRDQVDGSRTQAQAFFSGDATVDNPQQGPLRDHYNNLQRILGRRDLPAADRPALEREKDATLRQLFYQSNVAPKFQGHYQQRLDAGFGELGLQTPNFAQLPRKEALARIAEFEAKLASNPGASAARQLAPYLASLRDLTPAHIPETWI